MSVLSSVERELSQSLAPSHSSSSQRRIASTGIYALPKMNPTQPLKAKRPVAVLDALTTPHLAAPVEIQHPYRLKSMKDIAELLPHGLLTASREPRCERGRKRLKLSATEVEDPLADELPQHKGPTKAQIARRTLQEAPIQVEHVYWDLAYQRVFDNHHFQRKLQLLHSQFPFFHMDDSTLLNANDTKSLDDPKHIARAHMPLHTAEHESRLLKQAGTFWVPELEKYIHFPACANGPFCVAYTKSLQIAGLHEPIVLMSIMSQEEYIALLSGPDAGEEGVEWETDFKPRSCVLCYRQVATSMIMDHRYARMNGEPTPLAQASADPRLPYHLQDRPIQAFYNVPDQPGGYHSDCMLLFQNHDPFMQPIVTCNLSMLRAEKDEHVKRWWIDQSRLVVTEGQDLPVHLPGEKVHSFLLRSKPVQTGTECVWNRRRFLNDAAFIATTALRLLRDAKLVSLDSLHANQYVFSVQVLQRMYLSAHTPPKVALACAEAIDAQLQTSTEKEYLCWSDGQWNKVCTITLLSPALSLYAQNMAWFAPLAEVISAILHLMTKFCVLARCQSRTLSKVIRERLILRTCSNGTGKKQKKIYEYQDYVFQLCKQVVLCALLGNYPHAVPSSRPPVQVRQVLYKLFTVPRYDRWCASLFHHSTTLLAFAFRTYMVFLFDHVPALQYHLQDLISLPHYRSITENAMCTARVFFNRMIHHPASVLHQHLQSVPERVCHMAHLWICTSPTCVLPCTHKLKSNTKKKDYIHDETYQHHRYDCQQDLKAGWSFAPHLLHEAINNELLVFDATIKDLSFRRPAMQMAQLLRCQRRDFPLVPLPDQSMSGFEETDHPVPSSSSAIEEEQEDQAIIDDFGELVLRRRIVPPPEHDEEADEDETEVPVKKHTIDAALEAEYRFHPHMPSRFITNDNLAALRHLVQSAGPVGYGSPVMRIIDCFDCFGIPPEQVEYVKSVFQCFQSQSETSQDAYTALWKIRLLYPYLYNLLHIASELTQQCQRRIRLVELPDNITQAQMEAIAHAHTPLGTQNKWMLRSQTEFVYCSICFHIYSHIRDYNTQYKNLYMLGLRDASVSYLQNKCYCARDKRNYKGACRDTELARVPLVGRMILFRLKRILICPQKNCGNLMAFDAKDMQYMMWNERGPACIECTKTLKVKPEEWKIKNAFFRDPGVSIYCAHCPTHEAKIKRPLFAYMYDEEYLCRAHNTYSLQKELRNALAAYSVEDTEGRKQCIQATVEAHHPHHAKEEYQQTIVDRIDDVIHDLEDSTRKQMREWLFSRGEDIRLERDAFYKRQQTFLQHQLQDLSDMKKDCKTMIWDDVVTRDKIRLLMRSKLNDIQHIVTNIKGIEKKCQEFDEKEDLMIAAEEKAFRLQEYRKKQAQKRAELLRRVRKKQVSFSKSSILPSKQKLQD